MKFLFLFVKLPQPDIETQRSLGAEWLASQAKGVVDSSALFADDAKLVTREHARDFIQSETQYGGYVVINAPSLDEAALIAQETPHARLGGKVMVRPIFSF